MPELFRGLINFLLGLMSGFILFAVTYIYFLMRGKSLNFSIIHKPTGDVKQEDLHEMILEKQNKFKAFQRQGKDNIGKITFELSYELLDEISRYYFPKSKHPMLELSVNEIIALNHYITDRIDKILENPLLKNTRNVRITKIVQAYEIKRSINETKIVKAAQSKVVKKTTKVALGIINVVNPAYWFRKLVINTSVDFVTRKICLMVISVVGEETSKIYSKKLFDKDIEFDLVDKELRELESGVEQGNH